MRMLLCLKNRYALLTDHIKFFMNLRNEVTITEQFTNLAKVICRKLVKHLSSDSECLAT